MDAAEQARMRAELRRRKAQAAPVEEKSWGQTIKENLVGDDDPNSQNFGEKVGSFLNKAGESMTFGLVGDEASAAVAGAIPGGMDYDQRLAHERQQEAVLERDNPGAALTAEIGGGLVGAALPLGGIGTLGRGAGMGAKVLASGATGAGMGGTYGFMEGEGDSRVDEMRSGAGFGAVAGAAAPVIGSGVKKVADKLLQRGPTKQALKAAKTAADQRGLARNQYDIFEGSDAQLSPEAMTRLKEAVGSRIQDAGAPNLPGALGKTPKAGRQIVDTLSRMDDQVQSAATAGQNPAVPLKALDDVRKQAGKLGREVDNIGRPTASANLAQQSVDEIDLFIDGLQPEDMPVGDLDTARTALKKARDLWRTSIKTQKVENAIDQSDMYLSGRESGLRNQVKSLLRKNKKEKLFSPQEEEALKKVIGNNMLSRTVRALGDGLGRKAAMVTGGAMGGLEGAAIGAAAGEAASAIGESAAMRKAEIARALISSGALQNLPEAPDAVRKISETLMRRIGAVSPQ